MVDALLSRETPPSVEELMDEQDILSECKAQNNKCVYSLCPMTTFARAVDFLPRNFMADMLYYSLPFIIHAFATADS